MGTEKVRIKHAVVSEDSLDAKMPASFTAPEVLHDELIKTVRAYHPSTDVSAIEKAYRMAWEAHKDQRRKSGEPYIIHPICVGIILAELELDKETIVAGLLHDVVEDTEMTTEDITREFGAEVALLVDGVTKLTQLNYSQDKIEIQAENLRKMFLAMAKDIRVILIKLADRLHNMRTLQFMKPEKQKEKSRETMDIYSPIASRLGISKLKIELDDLSLRYLEPDVYEDLTKKIDSKRSEREAFIRSIVEEVQSHIDRAGIQAEIYGRVKHFFSIYKKMVNQNKTLEQIYDLFAVRIIVDNVKDCYAALGVIHEMYKPISGRFKDYIAMPKPNMYQSLHTTLLSPKGQPFEVQIRTYEMHRTAEYGIAAHWKYKEGGSGSPVDNEEAKLTWLRQILEWQRDMSDNREFLRLLKSDLNLFSDNVYCFTPTGDVKNLPKGSTPIDFAYSIHSAVGNTMVGARVNGKLVTINYEIQNGDRIEIITSQNSRGPSLDWLNVAKSTQAKNKINQWFKTENKEGNIAKGRELLLSYCKGKSINLSELLKPQFMDACMAKYSFRDWESVLAAIGHGGLKEGQVVNKLQEEYDKRHKKELNEEKLRKTLNEAKEKKAPAVIKKSKSGVVVEGMDDVAVRFSHCCNPVPGDEIVGFVTRGRGVSIHRTDCINIINMPLEDQERMIEAVWQQGLARKTDELYEAEIKIYSSRKNGVLLDVSRIITEEKVEVTSMTVRTSKQNVTTITVSFEVRGVEQLSALIAKMKQIEGVMDIQRTTG